MKRAHLFTAVAALLAATGALPCAAQGAAPAGASTAEPDPANLALAREVIELSFPPEQRHAMFMRVVDTMTAQARAAVTQGSGQTSTDPGLERILERYFVRLRAETEGLVVELSTPLFDAMARAYARMFTRDELMEIRAFVSTPTGRKYLQRSTEVLGDPDVARANTAYMTRVFATLQPMQEDLRREVRDYLRTRHDRPAPRAPAGTQ